MMARGTWKKKLKTLLSISSLLLGTTLALKATAAEEITKKSASNLLESFQQQFEGFQNL